MWYSKIVNKLIKEELNMYYQKQEVAKYNHYVMSNDERTVCLLGVAKDILEEDVELLLDSPMINYPSEFWKTYFKLNLENRQVISNVLGELEKQEKGCEFDKFYWDVFSDFLFSRYNQTLYDIADLMKGSELDKKTVYDRLDKLRKIKGKPRVETLELLRDICDYSLITDDVIRTGKGIMYTLTPEAYSKNVERALKKYNIATIRKERKENQDISLKQLILRITGLEETDIQEVEVLIAGRRNTLDEKNQKLLILFMKKLCEKQD